VNNDVWECLTQDIHCVYRMSYGPENYCLHKDNMAFTIWAHRNSRH